ncbi:Anaerobic sulfatase-maturating enzyme [Pandoraea aquatica]|uniref:Anaerobic sulfatase-maturating enzyme n=1 Tax=Pandoraea aquatica TaxID=2508290 RepID=A0A5E4S995_9BURK|nr:anaerobic sulfatase maturase [Pandoraea aquatica]VVD72180.1 Anaerobic sulfatase-maturating enzyme [Pandoraea aquatica]
MHSIEGMTSEQPVKWFETRASSAKEPMAPRQKGRFHAMAKPIGSTCNIDCAYCYYLHKEQLLDQRRGRRMEQSMLERYIRQYIEAQNGDEIIFSWQGGEPTMLGLDFFRDIVEIQKRCAPAGRRILNDLQTNGTLLDDDWCGFLKQHDFLVGISIDGPRELHDTFRLDRKGRPTFESVMRGIGLLKKHGVKFNTLTVVNRVNAKRPLDVYRFLRNEVGSSYIQFIPCVEPKDFRSIAPQHWPTESMPMIGSDGAKPGNPDSVVTDWSVDPEDWGYFLSRTFDEWYRKDVGHVLVNLFETAVVQTMGRPAQTCVTAEFCGKAMAIEHDGEVYSCDHYVYPDFALGNIRDVHLGEMAFSQRQQKFGYAKRDSLPAFCKKCTYLKLCWGECPKNRFVRSPDGEPGLNYLCSGIRKFYNHASWALRQLANESM